MFIGEYISDNRMSQVNCIIDVLIFHVDKQLKKETDI